MHKIFYLFVGLAAGMFLTVNLMPDEIDAILSVPPTTAFSDLNINDTLNTLDEPINSTSYKQTLHILTNGSIGINRVNYEGFIILP